MAVFQGIRKQFSLWMTDELRPAVLTSSLLSALVIYLMEVIYVISFASLVFSGQLSSQLPRALSFILIGNAVLVLVITLFTSYAGSVAVAQDTPGAVLGIAATTIAATLSGESTSQQFATVVMMIVFAS